MQTIQPSPREIQIIKGAAEGLADKQIAMKLHVAIATIRTHWDRIRIKSHANNKTHAVAIYLEKECELRLEEQLAEFRRGVLTGELIHLLPTGEASSLALEEL